MRKQILLFITIILLGCDKPVKSEKPFIVIHKNISYEKGVGHYQYEDANGNRQEFSDTPTAYKIGDTIY